MHAGQLDAPGCHNTTEDYYGNEIPWSHNCQYIGLTRLRFPWFTRPGGSKNGTYMIQSPYCN
jgi:hypothetical protein